MHFDGQRVNHLNGLNRLVKPPHAQLRRRVLQAVDAKLHRIGVHRTAVVKLHAVFQFERPCQTVIGQFPRLGSVAHELTIGGNIDQTTANVHGHPHHLVTRRGMKSPTN